MGVTKEQVQAEAKKLSMTLEESEVDTLVKLGMLPVKAEDDDSEDDDEDDEGDLDDKEKKGRAQKRIQKLAAERKAARTERDTAKAELKKLQDEKAAAEAEKATKAGDTEALTAAATEKADKADKALERAKSRVKDNAIRTAVSEALRSAGVSSDRIPKALKLFDLEKVEFDWSDEENLSPDVGDVGDLVEEFKKDNDFLFTKDTEEGDDDKPNAGPFNRPPKGAKAKEAAEAKAAELRRLFPALRR